MEASKRTAAFPLCSVSRANLAITLPWNGSMKQARNMNSFRFPSATVTLGFVAVGVIAGIFELCARSETGMVAFEVTEPMIAWTLCRLISRFAALLASVGSFLSSTTT